jgi:3-deoxy-manno-octulosonate cytidylyltransferase (CMP-KDO synthetase)
VNPVVVLPARMASNRLPGKPLADLAGEPLIVCAWRRAVAAALGPVVVACGDAEIADAVEAAGGNAVMTRADHPSGSDRVFEAVQAVDPDGAFDAVVNLQGDLPALDVASIRAVLAPLEEAAVDIATVAAPIHDAAQRDDPNVVKAVLSVAPGAAIGRALYFSRAVVPSGDGPLYHHIGLYAFRRQALGRFVELAPGVLEKRERLEQLRALENGMRIDAALVDTVPLEINTPVDLERARRFLARGEAT